MIFPGVHLNYHDHSSLLRQRFILDKVVLMGLIFIIKHYAQHFSKWTNLQQDQQVTQVLYYCFNLVSYDY